MNSELARYGLASLIFVFCSAAAICALIVLPAMAKDLNRSLPGRRGRWVYPFAIPPGGRYDSRANLTQWRFTGYFAALGAGASAALMIYWTALDVFALFTHSR
jgi:hypothetical protein